MHKVIREGDEWVCSCGLRWGICEDDPHPTQDERCKKHIAEIRETLKNADA